MNHITGLKDYIVVDIENPNNRGNSICSIGIVVVKDSKVTDSIYQLINPEDRFDYRNQEITGLDASKVHDAPTLKEFWYEIKDLFSDTVIVGHNITYDLSVISKSLMRYDIDVPDFQYVCTLNLSRKHLDLPSYSLGNIITPLGFEYQSHIAIEDAKAAHFLLNYISEYFGIDSVDIKKYKYECTLTSTLNSTLESNLNQLSGIIQGIVADDEVNEKEVSRLLRWYDENSKYKQYLLFNKILTTLHRVLKDNFITSFEKLELCQLCDSIHYSKLYNETTLGIQVLQGVLDGIIADSEINLLEVKTLESWLQQNDYLTGIYPYDRIMNLVETVLLDGKLDETEIHDMKIIFDEILNPVKDCMDKLDFDGKTYCLSGEFKSGSKDDIRKLLNARGCCEKKGVSSKLDYLFVGDIGSDAWKYGNYGGKVSKAQEYQEKGSKVLIISESDLLNSL